MFICGVVVNRRSHRYDSFLRLAYETIILRQCTRNLIFVVLDKQVVPTIEEMTERCAENAECFSLINDWLTTTFHTEQKIVFPYGNKYGWGIGHYKKKKLICNIFAEAGAFTVMMRLTNVQYETIYGEMKKYTQEYIDHKYPCGDGGWIHYRVTCQEHYEDIKNLLEVKCL